MFKDIRDFFLCFGKGYGWGVFYVLIGSVITGLFEFLGITLLYPLMSLVMKPDSLLHSSVYKKVNAYIGEPSIDVFIVYLSLFIAIVYVAKALFQVCFLKMEHRTLSRWKIDVCSRLFQRYLETDYEFHLSKNSAEIINKVTNEVQSSMESGIHQAVLLSSYSVVSLFLIGMLAKDYLSITVFVAFSFSTLFFAQTRFLKNKMHDLGGELSLAQESNLKALQQGIFAYKETKVNMREKFFCKEFISANSRAMNLQGRSLFWQNFPIASTEVIVIIILICAFDLLLLSPVRREWLTVDLAVIVMIIFRMVPMVNRSITSISLIQQARRPMRALIKEAYEINYGDAVPPEEIPDADNVPAMILKDDLKLSNVSYAYSGSNVNALDNVSLVINKGEFIGIIGSSGAGKTTLMGVLLGFLIPQKGDYTVNGTSVNADNLRSLRKIIGYVDQHAFIFNASIKENVAFGVPIEKIDSERVESALKQAELWDFASSQGEGIDSPVGENGKWLSGGQRQRLVIARALYKRPEILILDEATSALDTATEQKISETIRNLRGQMTIIAIAHRLSTLKASDKLVLMQDGHIVDEAPYDELLKRNEKFKDMVRMSQLDA